MSLPVIILAALLSAILLLGLIAYFIKRTRWPANKKKLYFTLIVSFLFFLVPVPAATIMVIPMPNVLFLALAVFSGDVTEIAGWYIKTWQLSLPSFLVTALICRGIAAMIFYDYKKNI